MNKYNKSYADLKAVVDSICAEKPDKNTVESLRQMLCHPTFHPIVESIEKKIIEIGNYLNEQDKKVVAQPKQNIALEKKPDNSDNVTHIHYEDWTAEMFKEYTKFLNEEYKDGLEFEVKMPDNLP